MTAWTAYALFGAVGGLGYALAPDGGWAAAVFVVTAASSVVAIVAGTRRHRPATPAAWWLTALGLGCWAVGDLVWNVLDAAGPVPLPSWADPAYLAAYPALALGLWQLVRARRLHTDAGRVLDAAVATLAVSLLCWTVLAEPLATSDQPWAARLVGVAYPVGDLLLLAVLALLVSTSGSRTPAFRLVVAAVLLLVTADTVYALPSVFGAVSGSTALDLCWLAAYVAWGAAALHPSMTALTDADDDGTADLTRLRLAALTTAVLVAPATFAVRLLLGADHDDWAFVLTSTAMVVLVVARMYGFVVQVRASTRERDRLADHLAHQAAHDPLTQVSSRARVLELVEAALHRARRSGSLVGLLYVDLDHFKRVNDTHGHHAGDAVLREVAARMRRLVRAGDTVGRHGGDEFVVLVEQVASEDDLVALADRLVAELDRPVPLPDPAGAGREVTVGASVGVAVSRDGRTDAAGLLHEADAAAYRAKGAGRGRSEVFDEALRRELAERAEVEGALLAALAEEDGAGRLVLHYQPVLDVVSGRTRGYEALVRWDRPGFGLLPPGAFVPVAERSTLVCALDRWVLREATRQLAAWTAEDAEAFDDVSVAVNVSGRHLTTDGLIDAVRDALARSGLAPHRLVLEVTETVLVAGPAVPQRLADLRAMGVRVGIDDFGTGYTSIGQLQHLHADVLKIDRSLVAATAPGTRELLRLVVHAAHAFGLSVVAEGVEDESQLSPVRLAGCDAVQGFLLARPMPADAVPGALSRRG